MSPSHLAQQLNQLATALLAAGHALDAQLHKVVPDGTARTYLVSWVTPLPPDESFPQDQFGNYSEYLFFLWSRQYSVVLPDGALVQISYRTKRDAVIWHRLAYIPCPITFNADDLVEMPLADYIETLSPEHIISRIKLESTVRFDYDPINAGPGHPASHATINRSCCRIPVRAPLHLRGFVRFVFSNFYPAIWESEVSVHSISGAALGGCIEATDTQTVHFHWNS